MGVELGRKIDTNQKLDDKHDQRSGSNFSCVNKINFLDADHVRIYWLHKKMSHQAIY